MDREALVRHVLAHGATLQERTSLNELYAAGGGEASIPFRPDIAELHVVDVCRSLGIPMPQGVAERRRRGSIIKKSEMVIRVPSDAMVLVIPHAAVRRGKRAAAKPRRKRNSHE